VAALVTEYFPNSHADVILTKILEGYELYGERMEPRIEIASIYLEQVHENDIGVGLIEKHGVPRFGSIGEALAVGGAGVNVDGVVLVGEHGRYLKNEVGQILYPRRRFFEAAIAAMVAAGKFVPIFTDKHLDQLFVDATWMVSTAKRLGVPVLAGSTLPLAWRDPVLEWPLGVEVSDALAIAHGPIECYGFHALEMLECMVERRAGGEPGVRSVQCLEPRAFRRRAGDGPNPGGFGPRARHPQPRRLSHRVQQRAARHGHRPRQVHHLLRLRRQAGRRGRRLPLRPAARRSARPLHLLRPQDRVDDADGRSALPDRAHPADDRRARRGDALALERAHPAGNARARRGLRGAGNRDRNWRRPPAAGALVLT
jgi:hypothetical protein